jgi:hypothetical protein
MLVHYLFIVYPIFCKQKVNTDSLHEGMQEFLHDHIPIVMLRYRVLFTP